MGDALRTRSYHMRSLWANVKDVKALTAPDLAAAKARVGEVFQHCTLSMVLFPYFTKLCLREMNFKL